MYILLKYKILATIFILHLYVNSCYYNKIGIKRELINDFIVYIPQLVNKWKYISVFYLRF